MLAELVPAFFMGVYGWVMYRNYSDSRELADLKNVKPKPYLIPPVPESPVAELVVELLRSDEGWKPGTSRASIYHSVVWVHETGVKIDNFGRGSDRNLLLVYVANDQGHFQGAQISDADGNTIIAEVKAFERRREAAEQYRLAKSLAKRIVDRGEVRPVLGGSDVPGLPAPGDDDSSEHGSTAAGLLTYNPTTGQVIASVRGDSVKLDLDASLRKRYELSPAERYLDGQQVNADTILKYWNESRIK